MSKILYNIMFLFGIATLLYLMFTMDSVYKPEIEILDGYRWLRLGIQNGQAETLPTKHTETNNEGKDKLETF